VATVFHELVHFWLRQGAEFGGAGYPRWLEEGSADVVADVLARRLGLASFERPLPRISDVRAMAGDLLRWEATAPDFGEHFPGLPALVNTSARYDLAYRVVKEVWERDGGKTARRLLEAFAGREEVPPPEEQERIFEEVVGEPLASVIERLARRAADRVFRPASCAPVAPGAFGTGGRPSGRPYETPNEIPRRSPGNARRVGSPAGDAGLS